MFTDSVLFESGCSHTQVWIQASGVSVWLPPAWHASISDSMPICVYAFSLDMCCNHEALKPNVPILNAAEDCDCDRDRNADMNVSECEYDRMITS
jgi:hypothetical protein